MTVQTSDIHTTIHALAEQFVSTFEGGTWKLHRDI